MKAVGYVCLNTQSQQPRNFTLARQEQIVRAYVASRGWELGEIYRETFATGNERDQPKLNEIISASGEGEFDLLVIARLDRLTRNIRTLNRLISTVCMTNHVGLVSIEEGLDTFTESGKLALNIIDIVTKWDTKRISDRTREMIAQKRTKGERVGHAPFGYTYRNKQLVEVPAEMETAALIREKRDGGMSYHGIAKLLNDGKIGAKRGGIWYAETIKSVFLSPLPDDSNDPLK